MDAETARLDSDIGPHLRDQFVLANGLARPFDESQKKVKNPSAERNGVACLLEGALEEVQFERLEPNLDPPGRTKLISPHPSPSSTNGSSPSPFHLKLPSTR